MAGTSLGPQTWRLERDNEGHRDYYITFKVQTLTSDGPYIALQASGLPEVGDPWTFKSDVDNWAFCLPNSKVRPFEQDEGEPHAFWLIDYQFSTRPLNRCMDEAVEDPLLEPDRISGSFVKYTEESGEDRNGVLKKSSSHEVFTGPQVEWDANRPTVTIEQNRPDLELDLLSSLMDNLNDNVLWGLDARKVKFSAVSWEEKYFGTCGKYYTRRLDFDINFDTFDRDIPDQGTKVLRGTWNKGCTAWLVDPGTGTGEMPPDKNNPLDFIRFVDCDGNPTRTLLDGNGLPLTQGTGTGPPDHVKIHIEKYAQDDLTQLGIPVNLTG